MPTVGSELYEKTNQMKSGHLRLVFFKRVIFSAKISSKFQLYIIQIASFDHDEYLN